MPTRSPSSAGRKCYREFQDHFADRGEAVLAGSAATSRTSNRTTTSSCSTVEVLQAARPAPRPLPVAGILPPENADHNLVYRMASPRQLLEIALKAERHAKRFFEWVAGTTANGEIHALADEMASEEAEHVQWVSPRARVRPRGRRRLDGLLAAGGGRGWHFGGSGRFTAARSRRVRAAPKALPASFERPALRGSPARALARPGGEDHRCRARGRRRPPRTRASSR